MRAIPFACVLLLASSASAQGWESVPDEPVERTAEHYPETNERAHSLYYPVVAGRGGGYLGVGSQQSYSIAAAQGADPIVLVDYDPVVTRLHRALVVLAQVDELVSGGAEGVSGGHTLCVVLPRRPRNRRPRPGVRAFGRHGHAARGRKESLEWLHDVHR